MALEHRLPCMLEQRADMRTLDRPGDLMFPEWEHGKPCFVDVTVHHPLPPSAGPLTPASAQGLLDGAIAQKRNHYESACHDRDSTFLSVLFTTFGGIVGTGKVFWTQFLRKLGAGFLGSARSRFVHQSRVSLSHRLMCAVGAQLESLVLVDDWTLATPASTTQSSVDPHGNLTTECVSPLKRPRRSPSRPNRC